MPTEIKFNAFGVPCVVEFANVSFKNLSSSKSIMSRLHPRLPRRAATLSHCPTCGSHTPELFKARSPDLAHSKLLDCNEQTSGLYIQLPSRKHGVAIGKVGAAQPIMNAFVGDWAAPLRHSSQLA